MANLNDIEIAEILKTWKVPMNDPEESGKIILTRFFEKYPGNLKFFESFQGKTFPEILVDPKFKAHGGRVVRALDNVIETAKDKGQETELGKETWLRLSNNHSRRKIPKESFLELKSIIEEVICEVCQLNEFQKKSWEKLLDYIFGLMCEKLANK